MTTEIRRSPSRALSNLFPCNVVSFPLVDFFAHDLRYATRRLLQSPGFTLIALCILGLGIGANTAIYSVVHQALFSPALPYQDPERTVRIYAKNVKRDRPQWLSYPEFDEFSRQSLFTHSAAASDGVLWSLHTGGKSVAVLGEIWSQALFNLIEFTPSRGRTFLPEEDRAGSPPVVILSYSAWQHQFGSDPDIIGKSIRLNGCSTTVIGVGPRGFKGSLVAFSTDYWVPWGTARVVDPDYKTLDNRQARSVRMFAGLQPGVTLQQVQARLDVIAGQLAQLYPASNTDIKTQLYPAAAIRMDPLFDKAVGPLSIFLMAVVGLALLVACSNLAGMLLSRSLAREREIAVRLALGASRPRLISQLLTESAVLGLLGGALGVILAFWAIDAFATFNLPVPVTLTLNAEINGVVLAFAFLLSLGTSMVFGLVPALRSTRCCLIEALKRQAAFPAGRHRRFTLQNMLVVVQMAVSIILLVTAGLFLRTVEQMQKTEIPFERKQIAFLSFDLERGALRTESEGRAFLERYRERLAMQSGIQVVAFARHMPLSLWGMDEIQVRKEGETFAAGAARTGIHFNIVTADYFRTMGIPILQGRNFTAGDGAGSPPVILVNETMANGFFQKKNPLGARLRVGVPGNEEVLEVVGMVRDTPVLGLRESNKAEFYRAHAQKFHSVVTAIVRTAGPPQMVRDLLQREIQNLNPMIPVLECRTMEEQLAGQSYLWEITSIFLAAFGLGTLALAGIGLYGVMSFSVAQRTREMGIRIALGAKPQQLVRHMLRQGLRVLAAGSIIGVSLAALVNQPLSRFLQGVSPTDPIAYIGVILVLAAASFLACYIPACRAARVDPMISLRHE